MKDAYNPATGYLGKSRGSQTTEKFHRKFSDLILKGLLRKSVQFICDREKEGVFKPDELVEYRTVKINETAVLVLEKKYPRKTIPSYTM